jgi:PTH1 family peptidyl-tRNA hydrolase
MTSQIKMVVGLGNPGKKYEGTRHNIGRRVVESLRGAPVSVSWFITTKYMNESGIEVVRAIKDKGITPEEVLVVLDEFQIPLKQIRILKAGSDGGHNGMKSVLEHLGTENVPRMRIGIGPLPDDQDPADFVLEAFSKRERNMMDEFYSELKSAVLMIINQGLNAAMNKYNNRPIA